MAANFNFPGNFNIPEAFPGNRLAAPSWVVPGSIGQNALFLLNRVGEIGLCFFEWRSCMDYGEGELPSWLAQLPFSWHIHMPLDLPWQEGGDVVAAICAALWQKAGFLNPRLIVLHPPEKDASKLLPAFAAKTSRLVEAEMLLENTQSNANWAFDDDFLASNGFGICLDIGHALLYSQEEFAQLAGKARLAHWSAPGNGDRHLPLDCLTEAQKRLATRIALNFQPGIIHMLEIFNWEGIRRSLPTLVSILGAGSKGD